MSSPVLSVILPLPPGAPEPALVATLPGLARQVGPLELILTYGRAAAQQRNYAAQVAQAELLFFVDDDCLLEAEALQAGMECLQQHAAAAVGGPAVTQPSDSFVERCLGEVVSSWLGMGRLRARATPVGPRRQCDGEELILCNLMIRKEWYLQIRGLDEELYPGEDVDLWKRLRVARAPVYYDPRLVVKRGRRRDPLSFCWQQFRYGQGRGVRFGKAFRARDLMFLAPTALLLMMPFPRQFWLPLAAYSGLCLLAGGQVAWRQESFPMGLCSAMLFALMHLSYGAGMLLGLLGFPPAVEPGPPQLDVRHYDA